MKKQFNSQERDAFAKAVSAVEGITFSKDDDAFFAQIVMRRENPTIIMKRVLSRAIDKI